MAKKWMIVLCFFSVLTFICSLISSVTIIINENARTELNSTEVLASNNTYKVASVNYETSNELNLVNLEPGFQKVNTFTITNNHSNSVFYSIKWYNVVSNWNQPSPGAIPHPEELIYTLSCTNGEQVIDKTMPIDSDDLTIYENMELKTNKSNTCTITIKFKSTGLDQSYNLNKSFKGTYKVIIDK